MLGRKEEEEEVSKLKGCFSVMIKEVCFEEGPSAMSTMLPIHHEQTTVEG